MKIDLGILAFWAVIMLGITALSGRAAAVWFAVGWIGASLLAMWEAGGRAIERTKAESENQPQKGENYEGDRA